MFLANYSDGLSDAPLPQMIELLEKSGKIGCFLAVRPPLTFHLVEFDDDGEVQRMRASADSDIWINAGYFVFRNKIFDYINDGEELVVEPFERLIADGRAHRLPPRRLLPRHGHAARQAAPRGHGPARRDALAAEARPCWRPSRRRNERLAPGRAWQAPVRAVPRCAF